MEQHIGELRDSGLTALGALDPAGQPVVSEMARLRLVELARRATARTH